MPTLTRSLNQWYPVQWQPVISFTGVGSTWVKQSFTGANPISQMIVSNTSASPMFLSFNGTDNNLYVPANTTISINFKAGQEAQPCNSVWAICPSGTGSLIISYFQ